MFSYERGMTPVKKYQHLGEEAASSDHYQCNDCLHYFIQPFPVDCPECESENLGYAPASVRDKQ
jgi:hypothetical protein